MSRTFPWEELAGKPLDGAGVSAALTSVGHNYMAKFVLHACGDTGYPDYDDATLLRRTTEVLDDFDHVGAIESIGATEDFLSRVLDQTVSLTQRNAAKTKRRGIPALSAETLDWIERHNRVDRELYDRYRSRL